jgi:hypothetical protein
VACGQPVQHPGCRVRCMPAMPSHPCSPHVRGSIASGRATSTTPVTTNNTVNGRISVQVPGCVARL